MLASLPFLVKTAGSITPAVNTSRCAERHKWHDSVDKHEAIVELASLENLELPAGSSYSSTEL